MARLLTCGFEARDAAIDAISGVTTGNCLDESFVNSVYGTHVRSGSYVYDGDASFSLTGATARDYYLRTYINITSPGSTGYQRVGFDVLNVHIKPDLTLQMYASDGTTAIGAASGAINLLTWYRIEVHVKINVSTNDDTAEFLLDGVTIASTTTANLGTTAPAQGFAGSPGASWDGHSLADDVALNDSTGSAQTSFPGSASVVLLVPTALSAGGTGWTDDNASSTATNLRNAVDNTPPQGIADTTGGGGDHQDRNATSNANSNLDMTMTTYTAAGIPAGSTINVIDSITATGAPVATSAKQGTVGVASNPAITNIALSAGGTSGAFWSGTAAGTYPSGWKISHGTTTYAPSVTLGTAPVMRVTQVTSSTRIAMVCFMGMYVDYTPPGFNIITGLNVGQAVNRASTY